MFFFCDFHGHSRNKNFFMYGCTNQKGPDRLKERIFPLLLHKKTDNFNFADCNFNVQKSRESTARVVMWKEFSLTNSYTLECTFCGPTRGQYKDCHFTQSTLVEMGEQFCYNMLEFTEADQKKVLETYSELIEMYPLDKVDSSIPEEADDDDDQFKKKKKKSSKVAKKSAIETKNMPPIKSSKEDSKKQPKLS